MDKLLIIQTTKRTKVFLALCFFLSFIVPATAQVSWSFIDNPHPLYSELSKQEISFLNKNEKLYPLRTSCYKGIDTIYKIYQNRYPEFQKSGNSIINFRNWKRHVIQNKSVSSYACIIGEPFEDLITYHYYYLNDNQADIDFYYCGIFSRPPANKVEENIILTVNEQLEYSKNKDERTIKAVLSINNLQSVIKLNPDVQYFLVMLAKENNDLPDDKKWNTANLVQTLSNERIAFLDEAVRQNNLQSVLDTTNPCKIR